MDKYALARRDAEIRFASGWRPKKLLSRENVKLRKAEKKDWKGLGLSLAPADISGFEVCASRSKACTEFCIFQSGHGSDHLTVEGIQRVWSGRILRTLWFFKERQRFMERLYRDIANNRDAAIRLNVFSDWQWERQQIIVTPKLAERYNTSSGVFRNLFEVFPETTFYDYTKHHVRMFRPRPANYHLTFSLTEDNVDEARQVLAAGMNIAAVVDEPSGSLFGYPVIDGDEHDLRFLDPSPRVLGLRAKGSLKTSKSKEMVYATQHHAAWLGAA